MSWYGYYEVWIEYGHKDTDNVSVDITTLKNGRTKSIKVYKDWHRLCKDNDIRLYSDEGKILYKKRSGCVENVFGNIKMNLKFERFNLRGFKKVQIEWNLISLAHNLQKLIKFKLV